MTAAPTLNRGLDPELRTRFGTPKRWTRRGRFGVLLSSTHEVIDRVQHPVNGTVVHLDRVDDAHDHAAMLRRHQPGLEFEVVRLENGVWRDYLGRSAAQVTHARWKDAA